jgi:hypothetical protein
MRKMKLIGWSLGFLLVAGVAVSMFSRLGRSGGSPEQPGVIPAPKVETEEVLASLKEAFRCTIYYTPRETGFVAAEGFDVTPETRPGLDGKRFGRDFLKAVEKEGFGRLAEPVGGKRYIRYFAGKWGFAETPLDCQSQPLIAKRSCAIKPGHKLLRRESKFKVFGPNVPNELTQLRWVITDTGSGLEHGQLDLYWGEDDPLGPGARISRPKTGPETIKDASLAVLR